MEKSSYLLSKIMSCNSFTSFTSCNSSCEDFEYEYEDYSMLSNNKLKT